MREVDPGDVLPTDAGTRLRPRAWLLLALLLAALPSLGTLHAPWIAEDAALLEQGAHEDLLADWTRPQGGLSIVRFWRPLVSVTWGLQARTTGIEPVPLRLLNLVAHLACAGLAWAVVRRLGGRPIAAFLAAGWIGTFPHQGGTVTWLAGRTDVLSGATLLLGLWFALGPRPALALPAAFLAGATKEFGFLLPLWVALLAWARGDERLEIARRAAWPAVGAALALVLRRLALGTWVGGYPDASPGLAAPALAIRALIGAAPWSGYCLALVLVWCVPRRRAWSANTARLAGAAALAALLATGLLLPLLGDGFLEPQNARLLYVPEVGLALAVGLLAGRLRRAREGLVLALLVLAPRSVVAWRDTHAWAASAELGERRVAAARALVAAAAPSEVPVLVADLPRVHGGAYCLGFGLASRFRPPFPPTPRPVWPLRPLFFDALVRPTSVAVRPDGSLWPEDLERAPSLAVTAANGAVLGRMVLDATVFASDHDASPHFAIDGGPPGAALEALVYTDGGYEAFALGALDAAGHGAGSGQALVAAGNGHTSVGETLLFSADLGGRSAGLELRALDARGAPVASSGWIALDWDAALVERALSAR